MRLDDIQYLLEDSVELWERLNATTTDPGRYISVAEAFLDAVRRHGPRLSLSAGGIELTYRELAGYSERIASFLLTSGMRHGEVVGVACARNHHLYAAVLGIICAGGAYLPIDGQNPARYSEYALADSGVRWLLTDDSVAEHVHDIMPGKLRVVVLGDGLESSSDGKVEGARSAGTAEVWGRVSRSAADHMYTIYTSGTTAAPKGVRIAHGSVLNLVRWYCDLHEVSSDARICQNAPLTFDPSVQQIFSALVSGAALLPAPEEVRKDPALFLRWLKDERISHLDIVPSHWVQLLRAVEEQPYLGKLPDLRWIVIGGESLYHDQTHRWGELVRSPVRISHVYGPTEATVNATFSVVDYNKREGPVPIGTPLPNYRIDVVDQYGGRCPSNIFGEIYIGGDGLALGYVDPGETDRRFVRRAAADGQEGRFFKTGDLGRLVVDDNGDPVLEFGGRIDSQLKLHGARIEPEQIQSVIKALPGVEDVCVTVRKAGAASQLICFYVSSAVNEGDLRRYLEESLPPYMVPSLYLRLDSLLLTDSGKVDRRKLLEVYERRVACRRQGAPADPGQMGLAGRIRALWEELLQVESVGDEDNFFALGGNSLLAMTFIAKLQPAVSAACRLADLYAHPTPAALGAFLAGSEPGERAELVVRRAGCGDSHRLPERRGTAEEVCRDPGLEAKAAEVFIAGLATRPMRRLELDPTLRRAVAQGWGLSARTSVHMQLNFAVDREILTRVLNDVIANHCVLRSAIEWTDTRDMRLVEHEFPPLALPYIDLTGFPAGATDELVSCLDRLCATRISVFDPPLFAFVLIHESDTSYRFFWSVNHVISDGESINTLCREIEGRYRAYTSANEPHVSGVDLTYDAYMKALSYLDAPDARLRGYGEDFVRCDGEMRRFIAGVQAAEPTSKERSMTIAVADLLDLNSGDIITPLLAICARATAVWSGNEGSALGQIYHGRFYDKIGRYCADVGNFLDVVPILLPAKREAPITELIPLAAETLDLINPRATRFGPLLAELYASGEHKEETRGALRPAITFNVVERPADAPSREFRVLESPATGGEGDEPGIDVVVVLRGSEVVLSVLAHRIEEESLDALWELIGREAARVRPL